MKKTFKNIRTLAALLIASAAFTACSNEDSAIIGEQPAQQQAPQVFTLTLQAGKTDGAGTRALKLDGTKLVAKWEAGDELTVINVTSGTSLGGTLTASNVSADGQKCTFSGTLTGTIAVDNHLTLLYHIPATGTQDGTLESAAAHDQAQANVTVASVDGGNITISGGTATFNTTTAVLKLTLKDGSANALNATSLKMTVDGVDIFTASPTAATYTTNGADGVLYFAVPRKIEVADKIAVEKSGGNPTEELLTTWMTNLDTYTVTFTATVGSDTYTATKTGYKLAGGKYYATELTMAKEVKWNSSKVAGINISEDPENNSFESDGITVAAFGDSGANFTGSKMSVGGSDGYFTFTSSVGNIKKIEINYTGDVYGYEEEPPVGWSLVDGTFTWSGTPATSVTLPSSGYSSIEGITSIVFTLE